MVHVDASLWPTEPWYISMRLSGPQSHSFFFHHSTCFSPTIPHSLSFFPTPPCPSSQALASAHIRLDNMAYSAEAPSMLISVVDVAVDVVVVVVTAVDGGDGGGGFSSKCNAPPATPGGGVGERQTGWSLAPCPLPSSPPPAPPSPPSPLPSPLPLHPAS